MRKFQATVTREGAYRVVDVDGIGATQVPVGKGADLVYMTHDMIKAVLDDDAADFMVEYTHVEEEA